MVEFLVSITKMKYVLQIFDQLPHPHTALPFR